MKNSTDQDRRKFLKKGIASLAGAALLSNKLAGSNTFSKENENIVYRTLGKTGIKIPVISMGTGDTNNTNLVKAALDAGIIYLATSQYYGNGQNEEMIAGVIKEKSRDSFLITTSAMPDGIDYAAGVFTAESKAGPFIKKIEESLKRLQLEYIDILMMPFAAKRESVFFEPILNAMVSLKKQGKTRFIGIATHSFETEAIRAAADTGEYDVVMTAYNFRKENLTELNEAIDYGIKAGLGIIAMKTMAGGYWDKDKKELINSTAALKWVLQNENIHTTVPGFTTFDQLQQNMALMADLKLSDKEKEDLKISQVKKSRGIYCQQCGECIPQCKENMDIPTIMRSYMYAYGYKNLSHAKETLNYSKIKDNPCSNCNVCAIDCPMGFDIKDKVTDIYRLKYVPLDFV